MGATLFVIRVSYLRVNHAKIPRDCPFSSREPFLKINIVLYGNSTEKRINDAECFSFGILSKKPPARANLCGTGGFVFVIWCFDYLL